MIGLHVLCSLLLASTALAHVRMTAINVNGGGWQTTSVRLPPNNSPVTDVNSNVSYVGALGLPADLRANHLISPIFLGYREYALKQYLSAI